MKLTLLIPMLVSWEAMPWMRGERKISDELVISYKLAFS